MVFFIISLSCFGWVGATGQVVDPDAAGRLDALQASDGAPDNKSALKKQGLFNKN
jgi:hypothetical protein